MMGGTLLGVASLFALLAMATCDYCRRQHIGNQTESVYVEPLVLGANVTKYDLDVFSPCPGKTVGAAMVGCNKYFWDVQFLSYTSVHVTRDHNDDELSLKVEVYCPHLPESSVNQSSAVSYSSLFKVTYVVRNDSSEDRVGGQSETSEDGNQTSEDGNQTSEDGNQVSEVGNQTSEDENKTSENENLTSEDEQNNPRRKRSSPNHNKDVVGNVDGNSKVLLSVHGNSKNESEEQVNGNVPVLHNSSGTVNRTSVKILAVNNKSGNKTSDDSETVEKVHLSYPKRKRSTPKKKKLDRVQQDSSSSEIVESATDENENETSEEQKNSVPKLLLRNVHNSPRWKGSHKHQKGVDVNDNKIPHVHSQSKYKKSKNETHKDVKFVVVHNRSGQVNVVPIVQSPSGLIKVKAILRQNQTTVQVVAVGHNKTVKETSEYSDEDETAENVYSLSVKWSASEHHQRDGGETSEETSENETSEDQKKTNKSKKSGKYRKIVDGTDDETSEDHNSSKHDDVEVFVGHNSSSHLNAVPVDTSENVYNTLRIKRSAPKQKPVHEGEGGETSENETGEDENKKNKDKKAKKSKKLQKDKKDDIVTLLALEDLDKSADNQTFEDETVEVKTVTKFGPKNGSVKKIKTVKKKSGKVVKTIVYEEEDETSEDENVEDASNKNVKDSVGSKKSGKAKKVVTVVKVKKDKKKKKKNQVGEEAENSPDSSSDEVKGGKVVVVEVDSNDDEQNETSENETKEDANKKNKKADKQFKKGLKVKSVVKEKVFDVKKKRSVGEAKEKSSSFSLVKASR